MLNCFLMKKNVAIFILCLLLHLITEAANEIYSTDNGTVVFRSEAVEELISATSNNLHGLIDADRRTFAFRIFIRSFKGFNTALQREHFNENYLESDKFQEATFRGKIIEQVDLSLAGKYIIRAKGILNIHGVEQERIIKCEVIVQKGIIHVESKFIISVADHDIKVPRVVHEKIAAEVSVEVIADFKKKEE